MKRNCHLGIVMGSLLVGTLTNQVCLAEDVKPTEPKTEVKQEATPAKEAPAAKPATEAKTEAPPDTSSGTPEKKVEAKPASVEPAKPAAVAANTVPSPIDTMLALHNNHRARYGLRGLTLHGKLNAAAQRYAYYSHRTQTFGHYADGRSPAQRISAEGMSYSSWAENMAWGQSSAQSAMNTWINSSGHHGNILSGHTHVGFGYYGGVWVAVFANPG